MYQNSIKTEGQEGMDSDSNASSNESAPISGDAEKPASAKLKPARKPKPVLDASFLEFAKKFAEFPAAEDKIHFGIEYMRSSLSQEGSPRFREFWEARSMCLPLFKEGLNSILRNQLWTDFVELSSEANRLKEILAEQSVFAVEQIDLAIKAFEEDLQNYDRLLSEIAPLTLPQECHSLAEKLQSYSVLQKELNLLNTLSSRINSLRKELLKTDMRIRDKNRFFKRLSEAGDRVFPRRKELIKKISEDFIADVDAFISRHFAEGKVEGAPLYVLREEIKALQGIAKTLTLNTHAFTHTRLKLSECWDKVKVLEKERKKEIANKKQAFAQNKSALQEKIKEFSEKAPSLSFQEKKQGIDEMYKMLREVGREDAQELRRELEELKATLSTREAPKKQAVYKEAPKALPQTEPFKEKINQLLHAKDMALDALEQECQSIQEALAKLGTLKDEGQVTLQLLGRLQDHILDRKQKDLLRGKDSEGLQALLDARKALRQEIKARLESYRKASGGSGFDFEKGMIYRELVEKEKERLDHANESIEELEEKISEME